MASSNLPITTSAKLSPDSILTLAANDVRGRNQQELQDCLAELTALCRPASLEEFTVEIKYLFDFALSFGVAVPDVKRQTAFYHEVLDKLPFDMLRATLTEVRKGWQWGNRLPLPAQLKEFEPVEWSDRQKARRNVREALAHWREPEPQPAPAPRTYDFTTHERFLATLDAEGLPHPPNTGKRWSIMTDEEKAASDGWRAHLADHYAAKRVPDVAGFKRARPLTPKRHGIPRNPHISKPEKPDERASG